MCDPTGITEAAVGLSSTKRFFSAEAAHQQQNDITASTAAYDNNYAAVMANSQAQQQNLANQRNAVAGASINNAGAANQADQKNAIENQLVAQYQNATAGQLGSQQAATQGSAQAQSANPNNVTQNQLINNSYNQEAAKLGAYTQQQGAAKAALDAHDTQNVNTAYYNNNAHNNFNINSEIAQGDNSAATNTLGLENMLYQNNMQAAQSAGGPFALLGTVLSGAGRATGSSSCGALNNGNNSSNTYFNNSVQGMGS